MGNDESFLLLAATIVAVAAWGSWFVHVLRFFSPDCPKWYRGVLVLTPPACLSTLALAVSRYYSAEVRGNAGYILLFTAVGAVILRATLTLLNLLGLDVVGSAVGQRNAAVLPAIVGAWLAGLTLNIGANIGEGRTVYTALGPLVLACALLAGFALLVGTITQVSDSIVSGRNLAAGLRFGALMLGAGLPLAVAASGDWVSIHGILHKFLLSVPVLVGLLVLGWLADRMLGARCGWLLAGLLPAGVFVFIGAASIA